MFILAGLIALAWPLVAASQAQAEPCSQAAGPRGCIDLTLYPTTLSGDVYLDGEFVAGPVNTARLHVMPGVPHLVEVRNVLGPEAGFGDIFVYDNAGQSGLVVPVARIRNLVLQPRIRYLKGYLNFTCDVRGLSAGQAAMCQPIVEDGPPLPTVNAGQTAQFALPTGDQALHVSLVGADAGLWLPAASDHSVHIRGGQTTYLRARFDRKGLLTIGFNVPGVVGDIYVDNGLVASQVMTASMFVAPGAHTVEGRNLVDPAANEVYRYSNASTAAYVSANGARGVTLRPRQEYLLGFGQIACRINRLTPQQDVGCNIVINGVERGTIEAGQSQTYNLTPGPHAVSVALVGADARLWGQSPQNLAIAITAGRTSRVTATFNRLALAPTPQPAAIVGPIILGVFEVSGDRSSLVVAVMLDGLDTTTRYNIIVYSPDDCSIPNCGQIGNAGKVHSGLFNYFQPAASAEVVQIRLGVDSIYCQTGSFTTNNISANLYLAPSLVPVTSATFPLTHVWCS